MGYGNVGLNDLGSVTDNDDATSPMPLEARKAISQEMQYSDLPLQQVWKVKVFDLYLLNTNFI